MSSRCSNEARDIKDIEEVADENFHRNHREYPENHRRYQGAAYCTYGDQRGCDRQRAKVAILYYARATNVVTAIMDWRASEQTIRRWQQQMELSEKVPHDILRFWGTEIMSEEEWDQKRIRDRNVAATDSHIARLKSRSQGGIAQTGDNRRVNALLSLIAQQNLKKRPAVDSKSKAKGPEEDVVKLTYH
eukprot:gene7602-9054_t